MLFIVILVLVISTSYMIKANENVVNLFNYVVFIDAGHGGKDNGASYNNVLEDTINLSINNLLVNKLIDVGATVYTTRDGDYDLADNYDNNRKNKDLKRRVELINNIRPNLFLSIHLNTYSDDSVKGGQVFYQDDENSEVLANFLQEQFNRLSLKNKKAKKGDYYLLNKTIVPGVIVECGFLTNQDDLNNLQDHNYQEKIVESIIRGIYLYLTSMDRCDNVAIS